MKRWVLARRRITGNPTRLKALLVSSTPALLQAATDTEPSPPRGDGSFALRLFGRIAGIPAHKTVWVTLGEVRRRDNWLSIPIRWEAENVGHLLFPAFEGTIEVEDLGDAVIELAVIGYYHPPLSPVGDIADAMGVREVAEATTRRLTERLARVLSDRVHGDSPPALPDRHVMAVADVMTEDPLVFVEDMSVRTAAALLLSFGISGAPVVDERGQVVGVLSERDLLDKNAEEPLGLGRKARTVERHRHALTTGQACTRPARTTQADSPIREAAQEMAKHDVDRLVVLRGGDMVGIVTRTDVLKALTRSLDDLEEAVRDVLAEAGHEDFEVVIDNGVVELVGETRLLSEKIKTRGLVEAVDGVLRVMDEDVTWHINDLIPSPLPFT